MAKITIRHYHDEDLPAIINLLRLNTPSYFAPEEESDLVNYLNNEIELYYVVLYGEKLIGCGGVNFVEEGTIARISWDIIHPEFQGRSIGSLFLDYRIKQLEAYSSVTEIVVRTSQLVYKFYQKQGFELQFIKKDYWAKGFDLYYMVYRQSINY